MKNIAPISKEKKVEEDLRESEKKLQTILDQSPFPVGFVDINDEIILYWSQSAKETFGHNPSTLSEWYELAYPDPEYREEVMRSWKPYLEKSLESSRVINTGEYKIVCKDGTTKICEIYAQFIPNHLIVTLNNITERKNLENQLLQSQKLESVGNLAGGIAHEFNNILSIIIGNNELIMEDLPEWSLSRESCEEIRIAGLRARDIVKHLLTFSRQDSSTKKPINIVSVVKESLKLIRSTTPTNIKIRENISTECDPVLGDATQINQILINLCSNAVDVLPISNGRIDIELCDSDISQDDFRSKIKLPPGKYVKLLVRDNGSGMDKSIRDRIFDPYFTTKDIGKGSGIGLAVVHGIVENHGGSIVCDSSKDQGTTFTIMIPAYDGPLGKELDEKDIFFGNGEKILYVDDEPSISRLGKRHLEALGYDAFSTTDPKEALEMIKAEPDRFNLIISDMAMPEMPGDQLIAEILSINPKMPTMICSGYSSQMSETKASEMGIKAFVMKPLNKKELAKKVREVLGSSKQS